MHEGRNALDSLIKCPLRGNILHHDGGEATLAVSLIEEVLQRNSFGYLTDGTADIVADRKELVSNVRCDPAIDAGHEDEGAIRHSGAGKRG